MQRRTLIAIVAGGGVLVAGAAAGVVWKMTRRAPSIVDVSPRNTALVVEIDLEALRKSGRGREAIDALEKRATKDSACATSVLSAVDRFGVAVPFGAAYQADFAFVALGKGIRAKTVIDCGRTILEARDAQVVVQSIGSFTSLQQQQTSAGERAMIAARDGGPIVVGSGVWVGAIVDVADGVGPSLRGDAVHDDARRARRDALATITYALPPDVRSALAEKLPKEAKPLADVSSVVASVRIDDASGLLLFDAEASCAPCEPLKPLLDNAKDVLARDPRVTLLGLRESLDAATIAMETKTLKISLKIPLAKLDAIADQITSPSPPIPELPSGHPSASATGPMAPPTPSASTTSSSSH